MSQPESGGMGISVDTFDFVCTDSSLKPPKCPLGFCLDAECQTCYDSENPDPEDPEDPEDPFDPEAPPQKKKKGCFSGAMLVNVHQKGLIRMDEVQIGDIVRTKAGELSRIYSFSHKDRNALSPYLEVTFQDEHSPLEVTHDHMLHSMCDDESGPCLVPAGDLKAGDKLIDSEGMAMDIQSIRSVQARGLYAPLTTTGDIVVNGVAASTYIVMPQAFQKYFSFEMQAAIQHFGLGMYRTYCTAVGCVHETYNAEGFPAAVTMWFPILDVLGWILDNVFTLAVVVIGYLTWKNRGSKGTGESDAGACHPMKVARD